MIEIKTKGDVPNDWMGPLKAVKTTSVKAVLYEGEVFNKLITAGWFSDFTTLETEPYLLINPGTEDCYPVRMDAFYDAYKRNEDSTYSKRESTPGKEERYLIPSGLTAKLHSLEGSYEVTGPAFLVVGTQGEIYYNTVEWADKNLDFL